MSEYQKYSTVYTEYLEQAHTSNSYEETITAALTVIAGGISSIIKLLENQND